MVTEMDELQKVLTHIIECEENTITSGEALQVLHDIMDNTPYQDFEVQPLLESCQAYWIVQEWENERLTDEDAYEQLENLSGE